MVSCLLLVAVAILGVAEAQISVGTDATRVAGSTGSDVVDAVVDLIRSNCIFSEDRLLLRRIAYIESRDGTDPKTYRTGYDGGIWQVDEDKFNATLRCNSVLRQYCNLLKLQPFNIDWTQVTWSDLRKPLYSGLAASLYLIQRLGANLTAIPGDVLGQADLWSHYYHFGAPLADYSGLAASATTYSCESKMDIAFVLDSSGSIINSDFRLSLNFVARVVEELYEPERVRVASLIYADTVSTNFNFNTYNTKAQITNAIRSISRITGGTYTNLALDTARTTFFSGNNNAKRLVILVTDGQSASTILTAAAAQRLKNKGIVVFAVGVGGYDPTELHAVASSPVCSHVFTLGDFSFIESILDEIKRSTCLATTMLSTVEGTPSEVKTNSSKPFTIGISSNSTQNTTVSFQVNCGILDVYVSYTNPNPNAAMYTEKYTAQTGRPAYLTTSGTYNGQQVYITVVGTRLPANEAHLQNCTDYYSIVSLVDKPVWQVRCCNGATCRDCTATDFLQQGNLLEGVCDTRTLDFANPCTPEALVSGKLLFAYPYDTNKFIRCDYHGEAYLTLCPGGKRFNPNTLTCGYEITGDIYRVPLPLGYPNPCTPERIAAQYLYFEYTLDRQLFIHCDLWGGAWLQTCPAQEMWSQNLMTCVVDQPYIATTNRPATITNPCTPSELALGRYFHPYPCDHTRYIHCDVSGQYWVQFCPNGMFYNPSLFVCVVGDPQSYAGCNQ
ncbi:hypothetical protein C0Q70_12617 [Pomacea canaliculata]|uniref:Chitinase n=2 Tax=Pomacea canaliculata TaxID=400727 RepID=A0A2T7P204_POMCA|nr:uncharacterized protein LOC112568773 isoform X2 [Pomacea canaliculata]XP_025102038.1 uncharacterized protein LOC112568773 isoform X2 [Pomacea canaliculata]XP_025102039.1 uncharacterized protein LOC112568773 isoform X2 [Pomacea canaliculata]PVD27457.1 hypothetical protein C0Q70_12617 [Pomacea canaliculata]